MNKLIKVIAINMNLNIAIFSCFNMNVYKQVFTLSE